MMRDKIIYIILLVIIPVWGWAQNPNGNYNPYVNSGTISPSPLWPVEANGIGIVSFNFGNSGSDQLKAYEDQYITLTITVSYGAPDHADPTAAVGGSAAGFFTWSFTDDTYSAKQTGDIPPGFSGTIEIAYKVTVNSANPGQNGFNVNIAPAAYQTESNSMEDDAVSSYTYTEIRDYGDAPSSYGAAWHIIDFKNYLGSLVDGELNDQPSDGADADDLDSQADEDGILFPSEIPQGESVNVAVTITGRGYLNGWIDWNADGDFEDTGERVANNVGMFAGTQDLQVNVPMDAVINTPTYARFRFANETLSGSGGSGDKGEVEDYMITITASANAPTAPGDLQADQSTQDAVTLAWSAATDNIGVEGYTIYRDENELATTTSLSYTDNTVTLGSTYNYYVSAYDGDGYISEKSSDVSIEIVDISDPSVPFGLDVYSKTSGSVSLSWNASTDNVGVIGYNIYRDGSLLASESGLAYIDNTVIAGNTYEYSVSSLDEAENESNPSSVLSVEVLMEQDTEAPTVPAGLMMLSLGESGVELAWHTSTDNVGVIGYNIYRDGEMHGTADDTTMMDREVIPGHTYSYRVTAFDTVRNESERSEPLSITLASTEYVMACQLSVYPNPSRGEFILELEGATGDFLLQIISPMGNIIVQQTIHMSYLGPEIILYHPEFPPGLYNIRVYRNDAVYFGKLMIIH